MRLATFLAASVATVALCAGSPALAGQTTQSNFTAGGTAAASAAVDLTTADPADGSPVYGVRGRTVAVATGTGTFEIINPGTRSSSPTPDPCTGGWCDTPAHIAATAFGWDGHAKGTGVVIGIIDTGIDLNHPDFAGRILPGTCIVSSVNPCTTANDQIGGDSAVFPGPNSTHGTHVAGIAAGAITGIATQAMILPVKVCSSTSSSCNGVDAGILWASQHGAKIISVSIGGPILSPSDVTTFQQAIANGALLVVAGGNSGNKDPSSGFLAGAAMQDGVRGSMIVVGSSTAGGVGGHGAISSFSQVPSTQCEVHGGQRFCMEDFFVVAPGSQIWSTVGNGSATGATYGYLSGTSMATPYVSGVAAVIKGNSPSLTSSQIASIIFQTADDVGAPGVDPIYGRGAVDITKALAPVGNAVVVTHSISLSNSGSSFQNSVVTAVGGGQASAAVLSQFGALNPMNALVSGAFAVALQNSTILKNAIVVDSFGRSFQADLTRAAFSQPMVDLNRYAESSLYQTYAGFGGAVDTPLGLVSASGYTVTTTTPKMLSGEYLTADRKRTDLRNFEASLDVMPGVSLQAGYNMESAGRFNSYDAAGSRAYDGLFFSASAVNSPYVGLTDGGNYIGSTISLGDSVRMQFGASSLAPQNPEYEAPVLTMVDQLTQPQTAAYQRHAQGTMAGLTWDFARWGGVGVTLSQTDEQNGLLGGITTGAMAVNRTATTTAMGLSSRVGFGDGWVSTLSYSEGVTHLALQTDGLVDGADVLHSRSYGVAISKFGVFGQDDSVGFALSRPIHVYQGGVDLTAATGVDSDSNVIVSHEHVSLASATPETDIEAGYVTSFLDGALSLQANTAYQMNVDGRTNVNAVTFLSRASINF